MAGVDFKVLRARIGDAARQAFEKIRTSHPDEKCYAFALHTIDDAVGISPSANTEQAFARQREENDEDDEEGLLGNFRWSPFDWEYDCESAEAFDAVDSLIHDRGQGRYSQDDPDGFTAFKAGVFASMVLEPISQAG